MNNKDNLMCSSYILGTMLEDVLLCLDAEISNKEDRYFSNKISDLRKSIKVFLKPINISIKKSNECDLIEDVIFRQHTIFENISKLNLEDFEFIEKEIEKRLNYN